MIQKSSKVALRASLLYGIIAGLWAFFSDELLDKLVADRGRLVWLEMFNDLAFVAFTGAVFFLILRRMLASEAQKIRDLQKAEALSRLQKETLEMIARGHPLAETLTVMLRGFETLAPDTLGSVLLLEADGLHLRHGAAPSLSPEYVQAADGLAIGPLAGSCGTAAFRGSPVFVSDIAQDPLWVNHKELALAHGLRSCWSTPIFDDQNKVLGTFAVYHRQTGLPNEHHVAAIELATHLATTAILKERAEKTLRENEERFRALVEQASDAILVHDLNGKLLDVNQQACASLGYTRDELLQLSVVDIETGFDQPTVQTICQSLQPGQPKTVEVNQRRKDGTIFPAEVSLSFYQVRSQQFVLAVARDISERKEQEAKLAESVSLLRATIESSDSGILVVDNHYKVTIHNQRFLEMWRISDAGPARSDDRHLIQLVLEQLEDPPGFLRRVQEIYGHPEEDSFETIFFKDGRVFERYSRPQRLGEAIIGRVWSFHDVTEQKRAERATQHERQLLRTLVDLAPDFIFVKDTQHRFLVVNEALAKCYGLSPAELLGRSEANFLPPEPAARSRLNEQRVLADSTFSTFEDTFCFPDGRIRTVITNMVAFRDAKGQVGGLVGFERDVSTQRLAERSMRLQSVALETAANAILITDHSGAIEWINPAFTLCTGYTLAECLGQNPRELVRSNKQDQAFYRAMWQTILAGKVWQGELINRRKDGSLYLEEMTITPLLDRENRTTHFIAIKQDISRRKQLEEEVRAVGERNRFYMNRMPLAFIAFDTQFHVAEWNAEAENVFGWTAAEAVGRHAYKLIVPPEAQSQVDRVWEEITQEGNVTSHSINENITKNGRRLICEWRNTPWRDAAGQICGCLSIVSDISDQIRAEKDRQNLELQLRQSQKMEAIGQLSGGIAHDFNNILTIIQGNAALLQDIDPKPAEMSECVTQIANAADRAAGLTRQLLMFSRKQQMLLVQLDLNETAAQMTKMLQRILGEDIALRSEYAPALPLILADIGMIEQIILNLAVNARDAMTGGGKLTIRTTVEKIKRDDQPKTVAAERHVCLSVTDTGSGISPEVLPRIFEPFFTTKEVGKGTGLGLATVYGIVQQHRGQINVTSEIGKGTTFSVYFPALRAAEIIPDATPSKPVLVRGSETILLVEDEQPLRTFVKDLLHRCGYTVLTADSGPAALKIWREQQPQIHLVFTDVIMPESLNGLELGCILLADRPSLKIIYTSGYTGDTAGSSTLIEGLNFIRKPFKPEAIVEIIRKKLDEPVVT